jgi:hypothetical protein
LKVKDFASLHDDITDLLKPLAEDGLMGQVLKKYVSAVTHLHTLKTSLKNVKTVTGDASKTLKALKKELAVFINTMKRARTSQSKVIQPIAQAIYDEYVVALNGNRLNVINAKDIIKVFVAKLAELDQAAIKAAGYEEYVTYITNTFATYTNEHANAMQSQENSATLKGNLIDQRNIIDGTYQMMIMTLTNLEYSTGDRQYTTTLNAIMLRVTNVKTSQKANATKAANKAEEESKPTGDNDNGNDGKKTSRQRGR